MRERINIRNWVIPGGLPTVVAAFALGIGPACAWSAETRAGVEPVLEPRPLIVASDNRGLAFDLGGSDVRKLQLELEQPLSLQVLSGQSREAAGLVLAGSSLNYAVGENFSLSGGSLMGQSGRGFQSVGSIHCVNGTLNALSYRAANCYFVDDRAVTSTHLVNLGARYDLGENARTGFSLFRSETGYANGFRPGVSLPGSMYLGGQAGPAHLGAHPLSDNSAVVPGLTSMESEVTGIDLEFEVGISTDRAGDMVLGLQLTRVLDGNFDATYLNSTGFRQWTIAEPYDSASLSLDWYKGPFSGGIQTYYHEQVDFLGRPSLESRGSFDVHFTWRAPWNASLSVGASNVLNAGAEDRQSKDKSLTDPFESIYGRIPYVRYKQDL